jgi:Tol biopolymer transport system component
MPTFSRLAYSTFDKTSEKIQTHIKSLLTDKEEQVLDISPASWMEWSSDGRAIYYTTSEDDKKNIWIQPLDGSKPYPATNYDSEQVYSFALNSKNGDLTAIRQTLTYDAVMFHFK